MKYLYTSVLFCVLSFSSFGQFWTRTNASIAATGTDARMFATHCGDTAVGVALTTQGEYLLTASADKGATWSQGLTIFDTLIDGYITKIVDIEGVHNRLYAHIQLANSTYYNIYYYSEDLGNTWTVDTAGLPRSFNPAYVNVFEITELSGGYMVAFNSILGAYFKHKTDNRWIKKPTSSSFTGIYNLDFTYVGNTWYALNNASQSSGEVLNKSTDFGQTWTTVNISGLPSGFAPYNLESNHNDMFYLSGSIAGSNADELYYSSDAGATWNPTNTTTFGQYTYASVYLRDLIAIEDYVFTTFYPTTGDTVARILTSNTAVPNFSLADVSGLPIYPANLYMLGAPSLNYFHIDEVLFITYSNDIYTATPGFTGTNPGIGLEEMQEVDLLMYPNPTTGTLHIRNTPETTAKIFNMEGQLVFTSPLNKGDNTLQLNLPSGVYFVNIGEQYERLIITQ